MPKGGPFHGCDFFEEGGNLREGRCVEGQSQGGWGCRVSCAGPTAMRCCSTAALACMANLYLKFMPALAVVMMITSIGAVHL